MKLGMTGRLARASARRPWLTIGLWIAAVAVAIGLAGSFGSYVTPTGHTFVDTESDRAAELEAIWREAQDGHAESVIVTSRTAAAGSAEFDGVVTAATAALAASGATNIVGPEAGSPVSPNGHSALITFVTPAEDGTLAETMEAVSAVSTANVEAFVFGDASLVLALNELASEELARSEGIGIVAALVILLVVFGAVVAAGLPIVMALVSIAVASGLGLAVARVTDAMGAPMSDSVTVFTGMLGLALGIDYSLLTVQRFREELSRGRSVDEAVWITGDTANRAVLLSGGTVVIALGGLLFIPLNTFLGIGVGVITVALAAVSVSLTLMPAVLRLLGHRVDRLRLRRRTDSGHESRTWRRIATTVTGHPIAAGLLGFGALVVLALPVLTLRFSVPDPQAWPEDFVLHKAHDAIVEDFGRSQDTTVIAVTRASADEVLELVEAVEADPGFSGTTVDDRGRVVFIDTFDTFAAGDERAKDAIARLREDIVPAALAETTASGFVGGNQATAMDQERLMAQGSPLAIGFILLATFLLLLVTFRSIVIPLKAIALNVLGTLATFGVVVAVYQWGWGEAIGLPPINGVSVFMPVMVFSLVFGLSMDYHVFLLSRIKEHVDATGDNRAAVSEGLTRTGPLITGAALIMIAVFAGFAAASIPELSQWGVGLAVGVLVDATIIRVLLVPASMAWLGHWNWYLPSWLSWLPTVGHEREPAQQPQPEPVSVRVSSTATERN
jgi:RND superfamily putative drug exporter